VVALAIDLTSPQTLYAGTWGSGVFRTTNGSIGWSAFNIGLTNLNVEALALNRTTPHTLYAATTSGVFHIDITTEVDNVITQGLPTEFFLSQNYPNPFNSKTIIEYQLLNPSEVTIKIYNIAGQLVRALVDEKQPAGYYSVHWDGKGQNGADLSSGVYICRLQSKKFFKTCKMLLVQ